MSKLSKLAGSVALAVAAFGGASAALADGYSAKPKVAYEQPSSWSGVYFGIHSGYEWSQIDYTFPLVGPGGVTGSPDQSTGLVGAHLGIQHQFGSVVLGVEGNWDSAFRDEPGSDSCHPVGNCGAGVRLTGRLNDIISVGPRIGWAAGHWMPYVTGGYASANFSYRADNAVGTLIEQTKTRHDGWYIGGGVEWIMSPGWTAGVEYRHYEFNEVTAIPFTNGGVAIPIDIQRVEPSVDSITARVSWKWGREPVAAPLK
jgi:outer membrane immunogenic protein